MIRVVLDTNILVRAIIRPLGTLGVIPKQLRERRFLALYSEVTLEELADVLSRPRMRNKYRVRPEDVEAVISLLLECGEAVEPQRTISVCRDPKDDKFLEIAVEGRADVIVTGDEDLLVLDPFEGIRIVVPAEFRPMLEAHEEAAAEEDGAG